MRPPAPVGRPRCLKLVATRNGCRVRPKRGMKMVDVVVQFKNGFRPRSGATHRPIGGQTPKAGKKKTRKTIKIVDPHVPGGGIAGRDAERVAPRPT